MANILLVDDDPQALDSAKRILEREGHHVRTAEDGVAALEWAKENPLDLILSDVRMPRMTGLEFVRALRALHSQVPVVLMTAFGKVEEAVAAMKWGAVDFLTKPFRRQTLLDAVDTALSTRRIFPNVALEVEELIGQSAAMRRVREWIAKVGPSLASVLIQGESGTGKERVARALHAASARKLGPLIAINCAALPENLMEAELFGWEKGAFTGASSAREGLIEASRDGTLFLDEIGDMPLSLQAKLLRVLQDGDVRRLGATQSHRVQIRLITATHRDLKLAVAEGRFREDLLYRLEVIRLDLPPLRERVEDIPDLAYSFLRQAQTREPGGVLTVQGIDDSALEALLAHPWPGNVRELWNVIERAVVLADGSMILREHLPESFQALGVSGQRAADLRGPSIEIPVGTSLKEAEDRLIARTLEATGGDKSLTAQILGVNSRTIYRWLDSHKDKPPELPS